MLSRTDDMTLNGGLNPDAIFTFALSNSGDELFVVCGNIEVDVVAYDDGETFPNAKGFSIVRGTDSAGMPRWCPASSVYDDVNMERGTPGADNDPCGELIAPSCWAEIDCAMGEYCMSGTCGLPEGSCRNDMDCALGEVCEGGRCEIFQRPAKGTRTVPLMNDVVLWVSQPPTTRSSSRTNCHFRPCITSWTHHECTTR